MCTFVEKRESKMRTPNTLMRFAALLITATGVLFSAIIYDGKEYTETMMPYSYKGQEETYIVVSGTVTSYSGDRLSIFEINGVNMNSASELPDPLDGKKYFIHFKGQNKKATININGSNDWSEEVRIDTLQIGLPFTKTGPDTVFFKTTQEIASLASAYMESLAINGTDYTNQKVNDIPVPGDGIYYIYYQSVSAFAEMTLEGVTAPPPTDVDTSYVSVPFTQSGAGEYVFAVNDQMGTLSSENVDSLTINNVEYTNQTVTQFPAKIDEYYYIYYKASNSFAELNITAPEEPEPEPEIPEYINYKGNDYEVVMMNYTQDGSGTAYFVVSGTIDVIDANKHVSSLIINNQNYTGQLPEPVDGKKYFIAYTGGNKNANLAVSGTNDWTSVIDTVSIDLPYTVSGAGEYYYVTDDALDSVSSSGIDELRINDVNVKNMNTSTIPEAINGQYYIYYKATSSLAAASFYLPEPVDYDTLAVDVPYSYSGSGRYYFSTGEELYSVSSSDMDTLLINEVDYTNVSTTDLPPSIGGTYYIYYSASLATASMILEPEPLDTVNISLPFSRTGVGEIVYTTNEEIESVSSSNVEILTINGEDYRNRNSSDMPEKINNTYYIYYKASDPTAVLTIQKATENPEVINWNGNDYTFIGMPWTYKGSSVTRVYTYGKITSFGTNNFITSLEINGQSYAVNQVHTDSPASIDQKYFITITPKNQKGEFEINGETKKIIYTLNIKVLLEGAL
jgi:hypothetical protein